jgi:hypothetical protein
VWIHSAPVAGDERKGRTTLVAQGAEEGHEGVLGAALGGPDDLAGGVAADDRQVFLELLVLDLVDGDGAQASEQVDAPERLGGDAHAGVVDGAPRDTVTPGCGGLGRGDGVVDDEVLNLRLNLSQPCFGFFRA